MKFEYISMPEWPPLAWVAKCPKASSTITVFHGRQVETTPEWFCEAIWDGPYEEGGFDDTSVIAGSGGRRRGDRVVFAVSSGRVDRLQSVKAGDVLWVSNSLPALMVTTGASVDPIYPDYWRNVYSIAVDKERYERYLAASQPPIRLTQLANLSWDGNEESEVAQPPLAADFTTYSEFRRCLDRILSAVVSNLESPSRRHPYPMVGTASSGYDGSAVCALMREHGLREVATFERTHDGEDDSGAAVTQALGMTAHVADADAWRTMPFSEVPFMAVNGQGQSVVFRGAESLFAGRAVFSGAGGDGSWGKGSHQLDTFTLSMTEYRLWAGYIFCAIPFWLKGAMNQLLELNLSPEMAPWDVPGDYSRPLAWRILREAGVPEELHPRKKRAVARRLLRTGAPPLGPVSYQDYLHWLRSHSGDFLRHGRIPPLGYAWADRASARVLGAVEQFGPSLRDWLKKLPVVWRLAVPMANIDSLTYAPRYLRRYLFAWALEHAQKRYRRPW